MSGNIENVKDIAVPEVAAPTPTPLTRPRWKRLTLVGLGISAVGVVALGVYWSLPPNTFDVRAVTLERLGDESQPIPGAVFVSTVGQVARTLLEKPGGYLYNDLSVPSIYLDNMPNWEYGVLKEVRDALRALRNDFSRSQTQSIENHDLRKADEFLNYDVDSWILPSTESEFREGIQALDRYFASLTAGKERSAQFFTRADNLAVYMAVVEKRLGSYAQRLSASVSDTELTAALVKDPEAASPANGTGEGRVKTPWLEIDDVFYEARGYTWALLHTFKALAVEFESVLRDKNATVSVQQIIFDLEEATKQMWSPVVLTGMVLALLRTTPWCSPPISPAQMLRFLTFESCCSKADRLPESAPTKT